MINFPIFFAFGSCKIPFRNRFSNFVRYVVGVYKDFRRKILKDTEKNMCGKERERKGAHKDKLTDRRIEKWK